MAEQRTNDELLALHLSAGRELLNRLKNGLYTTLDLKATDAENELIALAAKMKRGYNEIYTELLMLQESLERASLAEPALDSIDTL